MMIRRLICRLSRHVPPFDYRLSGRPTYQCTRCRQTIRWWFP